MAHSLGESSNMLNSALKRLQDAYPHIDWNLREPFLKAVGLLLARFGPEVAAEVTNPAYGIQTSSKFPPSLSEIADACRSEARRQARLSGTVPEMWRGPRALDRSEWPEGHLASVLVLPSAAATYARITAIIEKNEVPPQSHGATMRECVKYEENGGIMVPFNWVR